MSGDLVQAIDARLGAVDRIVGGRIVRWIEESELNLHEARVLLALAERSRPMTPAEIAEISGLHIDSVYRAVHTLHGRGITSEDHRHHDLSRSGHELMKSFSDARREGVEAYVAQLGEDERRQVESALLAGA